VEAEEACAVKVRRRLIRHLAERLGAGGALPQRRDERARPPQGLVVADALEAYW
jgi:hypothetical protein